MRTKLNFFLTKVRQIATQVPTDFWLAFLIFTSIFLLSAVVESDLGFHLETGRYIAQNHHVPPTDLFSFTVPDYPYINHSWLTELLLWLSFDRFGLWGLSFFYTVLLSAAFYILTKSSAIPKKHFAHVIIVLILLIPLCVKIINFRTQIVTFLFLSLLQYLFIKKITPGVLFVYLPLIFLVWVNMHGGFILGILFFLIFAGRQILNTKRNEQARELTLFAISLFLCILATLVNPYGVNIYRMVWQMGQNTASGQYLLEWTSVFTYNKNFFLINLQIITALLLVLIVLNNQITNVSKVLFFLFFVAGLYKFRYLLPLYVIMFPAVVHTLSSLLQRLFKLKVGGYSLPIYLGVACFILIYSQIYVYFGVTLIQSYRSETAYAYNFGSPNTYYPIQSLEWMRVNGVPSRLLNAYTWGGYLIHNFPGERFFIDGRMDNFIVEGESFLLQYIKLIETQPGWEELMAKYEINAVLGKPDWPIVEKLRSDADWLVVIEAPNEVLLVEQK